MRKPTLGLDQLNKGQAVGIEVVGEGIAFVDGGGLGLEDVGQPVTDQIQDELSVDRALFDMGLSGHNGLLGRRWNGPIVAGSNFARL
jgi:hypothetical protein